VRLSVPTDIQSDIETAERLEWWTLFWLSTIVLFMGLTMGSSQAMRTALYEDVLSFLPAIVFLVASKYEGKMATPKFPYGFLRVNSLAFMAAALALVAMGGFLFINSAISLFKQEHPSISIVHILGQEIWQGWLMIAALFYSTIAPVILGHMKLPIARRLNDKVLITDALMQKADWTTGAAGVAGIVGIALGLWWADAAAALFISFGILRDGVRQLRAATAELVDGAPRALEKNDLAEDAVALKKVLEKHFPGTVIRMRETGRYIVVHIEGSRPPEPMPPLAFYWPTGQDKAWRFAALSFEVGEGDNNHEF